jgi:glycosyltransferase involved in cell wall biosynthesis
VVLSRHAARAFRDVFGYQPRVIPPGADLRAFTPAPIRSERPTLICSASAEVARKNVRLLIEAFAIVRRQQPDARLVLSRPRDPHAARRAGVDLGASGVEWLDLDSRAALAQASARAWVAVLPSIDEAFGLVLVEALACGTPVVGYAGGGIPEIIDRPEIGRLFDVLDPEPLSQALLAAIELSQDPSTVVQCRRRAQEFSIDRCLEGYLTLYRELVGKSGHQLARADDPAPV